MHQRPQIVIDEKIPFIKGVLELYADVNYVEGAQIDSNIVANADALIVRTRTICNEALLKNSTVKFIATATIGTDHIDTAYCDGKGIFWTNAPGCNSGSVYQYIASVLSWLVLAKQMKLENLTLGVVGCGHVGSKIVRLGLLLGMKVLVNDPPLQRTRGGNFVSLEDLLQQADIVSLHTPLTRSGEDKTFHLIDSENLHKMKPSAWLVNSSRGEVVNGEALEIALDNKVIQGAVLDVWEQEPKISVGLLNRVGLATPHIAGYSADGKATATAMSVQALSRFFSLPLNTWQPGSIPLPQQSTLLTIDASNKTLSQLFAEVVWATYAITDDNERLRNAVADFEKQRGNYPIRREFQAYTINLKHGNSQLVDFLKALGFQVALS
ncbi:4-phosphoerythronate dehydrogenase [Paludibacter sp.]|uniref:4-phosphoerythronate dehydrogenase n=1 Tax=Paludibacter sp. TaxID=1898105 RepID=UPI001352E988|nr:4-phosphoerythronate dehydrogenase [Paludibacter sp.]MTK53583.1 4-phosphoerythronate dehydrogenase [Paludibacter sp.]